MVREVQGVSYSKAVFFFTPSVVVCLEDGWLHDWVVVVQCSKIVVCILWIVTELILGKL